MNKIVILKVDENNCPFINNENGICYNEKQKYTLSCSEKNCPLKEWPGYNDIDIIKHILDNEWPDN